MGNTNASMGRSKTIQGTKTKHIKMGEDFSEVCSALLGKILQVMERERANKLFAVFITTHCR